MPVVKFRVTTNAPFFSVVITNAQGQAKHILTNQAQAQTNLQPGIYRAHLVIFGNPGKQAALAVKVGNGPGLPVCGTVIPPTLQRGITMGDFQA